MASQGKTNTPQCDDLRGAVNRLRIAHLHLSNLLTVAEAKAAEETASIIAAATRYADDAYYIWEEIDAIVTALAEKGGK